MARSLLRLQPILNLDWIEIILQGMKMHTSYIESVLILFEIDYIAGEFFMAIHQKMEDLGTKIHGITTSDIDDVILLKRMINKVFHNMLERLMYLLKAAQYHNETHVAGRATCSSEYSEKTLTKSKQKKLTHHVDTLLTFYENNNNRIAQQAIDHDKSFVVKSCIVTILIYLQKAARTTRWFIMQPSTQAASYPLKTTSIYQYQLLMPKGDSSNQSQYNYSEIQLSNQYVSLASFVQLIPIYMNCLQDYLEGYIRYLCMYLQDTRPSPRSDSSAMESVFSVCESTNALSSSSSQR